MGDHLFCFLPGLNLTISKQLSLLQLTSPPPCLDPLSVHHWNTSISRTRTNMHPSLTSHASLVIAPPLSCRGRLFETLSSFSVFIAFIALESISPITLLRSPVTYSCHQMRQGGLARALLDLSPSSHLADHAFWKCSLSSCGVVFFCSLSSWSEF